MLIANYNRALKARSQALRKNQTQAEKIFWYQVLKKPPFHVFTWRRQKPLGHFIVDFYCTELRLVIEIDGKIHESQVERDEARTRILQETFGLQVIRFTNDEVLYERGEVVARLRATHPGFC
ncbi:MAG TPA: endonuclease domain-containing protein [bacterium]|nr:endonuclease domain-containing protein [Candidatus Magasanikbacteria bacterium]HPF95650.1 endonuclease domain-containing protein [bacterium]